MITARIAWRYFKTKKSHGAVSAIAAVSVAGTTVAVAAIICVLSVFNGFSDMLSGASGRVLPDIEITPKKGKTLPDGESLAERLASYPEITDALPTVRDQALAISNGFEMPVNIFATDLRCLPRLLSLDSLIYSGGRLPEVPDEGYDLEKAPEGLASVGVAYTLGAASPGFQIFLFAPRRKGTINKTNPASSFITDSIAVTGILESGEESFDKGTLFVPLEVGRGLFMYDSEATSIIIKAASGTNLNKLAQKLEKDLSSAGINVKTREEQQQLNNRIVNIEKWITFLLLIFILLIASFNIISTMTMLVLEKRENLSTLNALGLSAGRIGSVFAWESVYVTLAGALGGTALGVILVLLQMKFGFITMYGGDAASMPSVPYPVKLIWTDIPLTLIPVAVIGSVTALISAGFARKRL